MRLNLSVTSDRSPSTPVSLTNKTDNHDITEILLKVVLYTITLTHLHPDFGQIVYIIGPAQQVKAPFREFVPGRGETRLYVYTMAMGFPWRIAQKKI